MSRKLASVSLLSAEKQSNLLTLIRVLYEGNYISILDVIDPTTAMAIRIMDIGNPSAAFPGHKEAVACLLDYGADITAADKLGGTPLILAAIEGHLETVKLLVHRGADMKKQSSGLTALDNAALKGHDKVVDFLINAGARFDEGGTVDKNCNACGKDDPANVLKCIGCKAIFYCCKECQNSDWKNHKAQCRNIKAVREKDKDKSKIEEEMEARFKKFNMEEQAKNEASLMMQGPFRPSLPLEPH